MLANLVEYARQQGIEAEAGFIPKTVRWLILFNEKGRFLEVMDQADPEDRRSRGRMFPKAPHLKFSGDTPMRQFLVDTAQYALLFGQTEPSAKLLIKHKYFVNLLREAAAADPVFDTLAKALADQATRERICEHLADPSHKAKPADSVSFAVTKDDGVRILVEEPTWHDWWRGHFPVLFNKKKQGGRRMRCLVSGALTEPARTHPKIKGLGGVGGKVETTLVAFNERAFCSYGLEQSHNAAVSKEVAQQYAAALNDLIDHSVTMAGTRVAYWYVGEKKVKDEDDLLREVLQGVDLGDAEVKEESQEDESPSPRTRAQAHSKARVLLEAIRTGKRPDLEKCRFNALTLSGNSARVVVRDWMEGQFKELAENIDAWFEDLSLGNISGKRLARLPGIERLFTCLLQERKPNQNYDSWMAPLSAHRQALWQAPMCGSNTQIPVALAQQACRGQVLAVFADKFPSMAPPIEDAPEKERKNPMRLSALYARMSLMKTYCVRLARTQQQEEYNVSAYLDVNHERAAYHCGRLMAVLQMIQRKAQGVVGVTIAQTHYASASMRPIAALPRLETLTQHHLPKIEPMNLRNEFQRLLTEIHGRIKGSIPRTFDLEDQCLFHLGYYQQLAYQPYAEPARRHATLKKGEMVRSKSEVIVANLLSSLGIEYKYETPLKIEDGNGEKTIKPDFTVRKTRDGKPVYIEHLGMMDNFTYRSDWKSRLELFEKGGILPLEKGGGERGSLITTTEEKGSIDCKTIKKAIEPLCNQLSQP